MEIANQESRKSTAVLSLVLLVLFISIFVLFTYTFLHESGHALAGFLFGQKLAAFQINLLRWDAYVVMSGNLTQAQQAIQSMAGALLPLLVWLMLILLAPRKANVSVEVLKLLGSMVALNTLLAWIVMPILYMLGKAPPDDVTNFLRYSQMPLLLLTFTAIILYARGWALFLSKIDGLRNELLIFSTTDRETLTEGMRPTVSLMWGILAFCLILTFALSRGAAAMDRFSPPQGFVPVAEVELSAQAHSAEILTQFTLHEPGYAGVFIVVRDINTSYFDLRVTGPEGYSSVILHGEGYNTAQDGGLWEQHLRPGTYQVVLTAHQSPGTASVYLKPH